MTQARPSPSVLFLRFIHVVANVSTSFLRIEECLGTPTASGLLGCFRFGAICDERSRTGFCVDTFPVLLGG